MEGSLQAQQLKAHRGTLHNSYNFWFYTPPREAPLGSISVTMGRPDAPKPLVIFLHGASLCGKNLDKVRSYGTLDAIKYGLKLDAFIVAPQNPGGAWSPTKVNRIVDWAVQKYAIDTTRIYVLGMSLGGYGTLDYAAASADRVAAAMGLCGGATSRQVHELCRVPLIIMHGTGDRAVSWRASQAVVDQMKAAGDTSRLIYKLIPKASHGALARYLYAPETYNWLFEHRLDAPGRPVNRKYYWGIEMLKDVYQRLGKPNQKIVLDYTRDPLPAVTPLQSTPLTLPDRPLSPIN